MKKYIIVLFAVLCTYSATVKAGVNRLARIEKRVEVFNSAIGLTTQEKAALITLLDKAETERKQFKEENDINSPDSKPKLKEMHKRFDAEVIAIIGAKKFEKFEKFLEEERKTKEKTK